MDTQKDNASHFVITMTARNRDTNPLIRVYHDKPEALKVYNALNRIPHYYYKLIETSNDITNQHIIKSEYFDHESQSWKDTSTLYE